MSKVSSAPGKWFVGKLPLNGSSLNGSRPPIEFVLTNGAGDWDKPEAGGNYTVGGPGTYALDNGAIRPVHGNAPVLVVSDLDGTMVGDDAGTAAFKQFWEEEGVLNGGVLVYNTGRSLQAFQQLLREKPSLAHPDALITAVGTKIYSFNGSSWVEDKGYAALLDKDWTVQVVRDAAYLALAKVGKDRMHFRPPEEQSQHKVTCGVQQSALPEVLAHLRRSLAAGGADANLIASGTGDWRFLDIVPRQAGKLQALEYVQKMFGFGHGSTVACGDSGNDILMLSGECLAVVVGNAQPDLVEWVAEQQQREQPGTDGQQRLRVTQRHEAFGILEGLEYFGFKSQSA